MCLQCSLSLPLRSPSPHAPDVPKGKFAWKWPCVGSEEFVKFRYSSRTLLAATSTHKIYRWTLADVTSKAPTPVLSFQFDQPAICLAVTPRSSFLADANGSLWRFDQKSFAPVLVTQPKKRKKRKGTELDEEAIVKMQTKG